MTEEALKSEHLIIDKDNPAIFHNRELSWLDFNKRVLTEAEDPSNPFLEQLGFLAIHSSNLDEFFMVRVAGLQDQVKMGFSIPDAKSKMIPEEQLEAISEKNRENVHYQYKIFNDKVADAHQLGIHFRQMTELTDAQKEKVEKVFEDEIFPALTPLGIDAYRPFPNLNNKINNIFVNLERDGEHRMAIVPFPALVQRYIYVRDGEEITLLATEDVARYYISWLFQGYNVLSSFCFRITRNADLELHEDGAEDLLEVIEDYLKMRKNGRAVRMEVDTRTSTPDQLASDVEYLMNELELTEQDVYLIDGPLDLTGLRQAVSIAKKRYPNLVYKSFTPYIPNELSKKSVFDVVRKRDLFFHHPYDSFTPVVRFIQEAAKGSNTLAIKMTLYRVSSDSPIIKALIEASEKGIQITVLVELKARFDEENNVQWAKELEEAGCHVIYGMTHLKTHSKIAMVVKKTDGRIQRFVHLGTGNYNDSTARFYTDMGIITANEEICEDATDFFNYLSGYSERPDYNHLHVSPFDIRDTYIEDIEEEIENHKQHGNGYIIAKMNSLTSTDVILKLYEASKAGVKVDLIIRGICCLVPGIPGVSENIHVYSVVGRFLEHSRIYYFYNNGEEKLHLSSADMMTRNMVNRVEIEFPILDPHIKQEIVGILKTYLKDNTKRREKLSDNSYVYVRNDEEPFTAQDFFMEKAIMEQRQQPPKAKSGWLGRIQKALGRNN